MSNIKVLITGAGGYIGRNLVEKLRSRFNIFAPVRNELDLLDANHVKKYLDEIRPNVVVHAAAVGSKHGEGDNPGVIKDNLQMFYNLVRCRPCFGRMINFGSGAEYDKRRPIIKVSEADFDYSVPVDEYGFAKYIMAKYATQTDYTTHLRLFGVFGKYEDYKLRFISNAICMALFDLPIVINQDVIFDYLYVNDLVEIIRRIIDNKPDEPVINIGSGNPTKLSGIAQKVNGILNKNLPIKIINSGLNNEYTCDTSRLRHILPDMIYTDLDDAISHLIKYYQSILPSLDKKAFIIN